MKNYSEFAQQVIRAEKQRQAYWDGISALADYLDGTGPRVMLVTAPRSNLPAEGQP